MTVLIADDQTLFAEGLKTIIEVRAPDIEIVGIAPNGSVAVDMCLELRPDIVLMDVRMPVLDGVQAMMELHRRGIDLRVVMLTTFDDDDYVKASLSYGAIGYLLKNRPSDELIASLRAVSSGTLQIDPGVAKSLISEPSDSRASNDEMLSRLQTLTPRERDVLELLVEAKSNREIAELLNVADQTVKNYVSNIFSKLYIDNRLRIMQFMDTIEFYLEHFADS